MGCNKKGNGSGPQKPKPVKPLIGEERKGRETQEMSQGNNPPKPGKD